MPACSLSSVLWRQNLIWIRMPAETRCWTQKFQALPTVSALSQGLPKHSFAASAVEIHTALSLFGSERLRRKDSARWSNAANPQTLVSGGTHGALRRQQNQLPSQATPLLLSHRVFPAIYNLLTVKIVFSHKHASARAKFTLEIQRRACARVTSSSSLETGGWSARWIKRRNFPYKAAAPAAVYTCWPVLTYMRALKQQRCRLRRHLDGRIYKNRLIIYLWLRVITFTVSVGNVHHRPYLVQLPCFRLVSLRCSSSGRLAGF